MVDCCVIHVLGVGRSACQFIHSIRLCPWRDGRNFRQLCDVLDTEKTTDRSTNQWNDPLYSYAMVGGLTIDAMRSEGVAMMKGESDDVRRRTCVFFGSKTKCLIME